MRTDMWSLTPTSSGDSLMKYECLFISNRREAAKLR
jgi:hypothetical protein